MVKHLQFLLGGAALAGLMGAGEAQAQAAAAAAKAAPTVPEIVITGDRAGLLERRPNGAVMGLTKPLIETPRSASLVSATTIQRYGIQTINDFVAVSPNSYTASFYGVPGELDVRGTLAENYFLGFKLVENRGTYTTPIGDASQIDVVRGPPSPIYGPGKVGGFLNFIPKSEKSEGLTQPTGEIDITGGSYGKANVNLQFGAPTNIGIAEGGIYAYGEYDTGGSFYKGIDPTHELGSVSVNYNLPDNWSFTADTMILSADGDVQTPGWNRLTQQLVDNRTYITGQNTSLSASPGVGYLTPNQASPGAFSPYPYNYTAVGQGLFAAYYGFPPTGLPAAFSLNSAGAGQTVTLSPRDVYISPYDFSKTFSPTVVLGLAKDLSDDSTVKLQLFYNGLENQRFVSYGFPAWFRANAFEARLTYNFKLGDKDSFFRADTIAGLSYRYYQGRDMQSYDSGVIALDRRDLSVGATPTDTICDPFTLGITNDQAPANCLGWETDVHSRQHDTGAFFTTDIGVGQRLDFVIGARHDEYQVTSSDTGLYYNYDYAGPPGTWVSASKGATSYSFSLTYKLGWGLMPYFTSAQDNTPEVQQAGDLQPGQVENGFLSSSTLNEAGIKFQFLKHSLVGSLDTYRQDRSDLAGFNDVSERTRSDGVELEVRYLATKNISFTLTGAEQHTEVIGPDTGTYYIPAYAVCGQTPACELGSWGGAYLVYNFSTMPGRGGDYALSSIPHTVASVYGNYITDDHSWGRAGATMGATYVSKTSGTIQGAITYPDYTLVNLSAFLQRGPYEASMNIDNLFDTFYVTPNSDPTYVNVAAIPGVGREWRLTLKRKF